MLTEEDPTPREGSLIWLNLLAQQPAKMEAYVKLIVSLPPKACAPSAQGQSTL